MSTRIESADHCIIINGVLYPKGVLRACIEGNALNVWEDMERTIPLVHSVPYSDIIHVNTGSVFASIAALTDFVKEHFFFKRIKNLSELINDVGYLTSETDPTVPGHVKGITTTNISQWNTAYGWNNHAGLYALLSGLYDNPTWINSLAWPKITGKPTSLSGYGITDAYTRTQIQNYFAGAAAISGYNKANWDAAYAFTSSFNANGYIQNQSSLIQTAVARINGQIEAGQGRFTGWNTFGTGKAVEVGISSGSGYIMGYDRTNGTYEGLALQGGSGSSSYAQLALSASYAMISNVPFIVDGTLPITINASTGINIKGASGGWATGLTFQGNGGTQYGGFWGYGTSNILNDWRIGDFSNPAAIFYPDSGVRFPLYSGTGDSLAYFSSNGTFQRSSIDPSTVLTTTNASSLYLPLAGGTMAGEISMGVAGTQALIHRNAGATSGGWARNLLRMTANTSQSWTMGSYGGSGTTIYGFLGWGTNGNEYDGALLKWTTDRLGIGLTFANSPTNTLDVNGTARVRSLNNGAGDLVTTSPEGVLLRRTVAQFIGDAASSLNTSYFKQGGNAFGAVASLGTTDNYGFDIRTNGVVRLLIPSTGISSAAGNVLTLNGTTLSSQTPAQIASAAGCFIYNGTIPGSADLNTYTTTGFYLQSSNANAQAGTNYPTGRAGILEVEYASSIHIIQRYTTYMASAIQPDGTWFRYQYNGTWSAWRRVWSNGDFTTTDIANWNNKWDKDRLVGTPYSGVGTGDLNTIMPNGGFAYTYNNPTTFTNSFGNAYAGVLTLGTASASHQMQLGYDVAHNAGANSGSIWFRVRDGITGWKNWYELWTTKNFTSTDVSKWTTAFPTSFLNTLNSMSYSGDMLAVPVGSYSATASTSATNRPFTNVGGLISFGTSISNASTRILGARDNSDNLWFQSGDGTGAWRQLASRDWVTANYTSANNGTLTLATSGIATGAASFTANQSGNSTFTVNVPGTNLGTSTTAGQITSSTGANALLTSLSRMNLADANDLTYNAGLYTINNTTGSTNYPNSSGGGIWFNRAGAGNTDGGFQIWKAGLNDGLLKFRVGTSGTAYGSWENFASQSWVTANFSSLSSAFVQGGNSFGSPATLGTNDNNNLHFETNGALRGGFLSNGNFFIGGSSNVASFSNNVPITGGTTAYGNLTNTTVQSSVTSTAYGYRTIIGTQAASFTLPALAYFSAVQGTFGAGSSVTNQYGFAAEALTGATNNYGFWGNIASGTGRWNLYMGGTASNYLNGTTTIGTTTDNGIDKLQVLGSVAISSSLRLQSDHFANPAYSYTNGILITTDILATSPTMFELYITGNSYASALPINTQIQGYMYEQTPALLQCKGINYGQPIASVDVFVDANNFVCFWLSQVSGNNTLRFRLSTAINAGKRITSITNVARPVGTTLNVTINPINAQTTQINGTGFVKASGTTLSYDNNTYFPLLPTGVTGSSILATTDDWNNLRSGFGYGSGLNKPNATNSYFLTIRSNSDAYGMQIGARANNIYYRGLENSVWGSWLQLADRTWVTSQIPAQYNPTQGTGITITGTYPNHTIAANNTTALWNANWLQGVSIDSTTPTNGQILQLVSGKWTPVTSPAYITFTSLSGTAPITYNNTTGVIDITRATTSTNGYLSSTDWNAFNNKQTALSGTGLVKSTAGTISYITDNSINWNTAYTYSQIGHLPLSGGQVTGAVSIGSGSPGAAQALLITPLLTNRKGLIIRALPSQTENLQEWQDSSTNTLGYINSTGQAAFPTVKVTSYLPEATQEGAFVADRTIGNDGLTENARAFKDNTTFARNGYAYCSYDAVAHFASGGTYPHYTAFQMRPIIQGSVNSVEFGATYFESNVPISRFIGLLHEPPKMYGNTLTDSYALKVEPFGSVGNNNWVIHSPDSRMHSLHGGDFYNLGHLAIGTNTISNINGWDKVIDLLGTPHSKIQVRTTTGAINTVVASHSSGYFGSTAGGMVGTETNHPFHIISAGIVRASWNTSGGLTLPSYAGASNGLAYLDTSGNLLKGVMYSQSTAANTVVQRDINGAIFGTYLNQSSSDSENVAVDQIITTMGGGDNYFRKVDKAHFMLELGITSYWSYGSQKLIQPYNPDVLIEGVNFDNHRLHLEADNKTNTSGSYYIVSATDNVITNVSSNSLNVCLPNPQEDGQLGRQLKFRQLNTQSEIYFFDADGNTTYLYDYFDGSTHWGVHRLVNAGISGGVGAGYEWVEIIAMDMTSVGKGWQWVIVQQGGSLEFSADRNPI